MEYRIMWVQIKQRTSENIESESLVAHVALSKEREATQEKRLDEMEERLNEGETRDRELKNLLLRTITGASVALFSSIVSIAALVFNYIKQ